MHSDLQSMELPAFELDCRDWLVATPEDGTVPEEIGGAPVVAVLSTVFIGADDLEPASAVLSIGLLDEPVATIPMPGNGAPDSPVAELIDIDHASGSARYVVPAPEGQLALLAEFSAGQACDVELIQRFERLMTSFRWAS
ncbi:MAG TPA: hypothetical protein VGH11_09920 [Jatrophihabitans sp.]|jgi:hypothetical protein